MSQESEGHVCIFHQRVRALKVYRVKDTVSGNWFEYGLCPICNNRLAKQDSFKQNINDRLGDLVYKMQKQEEGKKNANKI